MRSLRLSGRVAGAAPGERGYRFNRPEGPTDGENNASRLLP